MNIVEAESINDSLIKLTELINKEGIESTTKANVGVDATNIQVYGATLKISNPRDRYLNVVGRNNNIFAMMAETFWTLAGKEEISPYLEFYLPRAKDFSDDGKVWRAAYGPRIYNYSQLQGILDTLKKSPLSRQAVIAIYDPSKDSPSVLPNGTKDVPCNNMIYFFSEANSPEKLNIHVTQRSGDVIWGMGSINIFLWTVLQEIVADSLGKEVGYYSHYVNNLHVYKSYDVAYKQFMGVLENKDNTTRSTDSLNRITGFAGKDSFEIKDYFSEVVYCLKQYITGKINSSSLMNRLVVGVTDTEFVPNSSIQKMVAAVVYYTICKKTESNLKIDFDFGPGLNEAILSSKFTNFTLLK